MIWIILAFILAPNSVMAATAHVQHNTARAFGGTSVSVSTTSNVGAGNAIGGGIFWMPTTTNLTGVTVCGTAATVPGTTQAVGTSIAGRSFHRLNLSAGACSIVASFDAAITDARILVHELSGQDNAGSVLSVCNPQNAPGTATDAITSTPLAIPAAGSYLLGMTGLWATSGATPGTGFTQGIDTAVRESEYIADMATSGNIAATFTTTNASERFVTCAISFPITASASGSRRLLMLNVGN